MATPYSQQASAGAEYLLAKNLTLRTDYLFVHGLKLPRTLNVNLLPPVVLTRANASSLGVTNPRHRRLGEKSFLLDGSTPSLGTFISSRILRPLSARPFGLGRNSLSTPALATMDFRALKYFPFGGAKRLDVVAESFNLFNSANVSEINPVFGSGLTPIPGFRQPIAGTGARQIQFSLDFEF